jgi:hypothetical protein
LQIKEEMSMDKKYLDKVLDQLVSETKIYREKNCLDQMDIPYLPKNILLPLSFFSLSSLLRLDPFTIHCRDVYGLNEQEIEYVWNGYRDTIKDRIKNG